MQVEDVLRCSECGAPIKPNQERCEYCGYWLIQPKPIIELEESDNGSSNVGSLPLTAMDVMVGFILASVAVLIGINLINPISSIVGSSTIRAINTLAGQLTWIFVALVLFGAITFLGILGKYVERESL